MPKHEKDDLIEYIGNRVKDSAYVVLFPHPDGGYFTALRYSPKYEGEPVVWISPSHCLSLYATDLSQVRILPACTWDAAKPSDPKAHTVAAMLKLLKGYPPDAALRFSIADDASEDPGERWFAEDGPVDHFGDKHEVTVCLVAKSNLQ